MKKRVFGLLLAICLMAGLLPVMAGAAEANTISVNLCEKEEKLTFVATLSVTEGGAAAYAVTDANGVPTVVTGSAPTDNYVKFEYPKGGTPTLTFKGAYLKAYGEVVDMTTFDLDVNIVVETDSVIESTAKRGLWRMCSGDLTITGPGKLKLNCFSTTISFEEAYNPGSLTLKNLTLEAVTTDNSVGRTFSIPAGNLTIENSTVTMTHKAGVGAFVGKGTVDDADTRGKITITNSTVTVNSIDNAFYAQNDVTITDSTVQATAGKRAMYSGNNFAVKNSKLNFTSSSEDYELMDVVGKFTLENSVVELTGTECPVFTGKTTPEFVGYYIIKAGKTKETVAGYKDAYADEYLYFLAEPTDTEPPTEPEETTPPTTAPTTAPTQATKATKATAPTKAPTSAPTQPVSNHDGGSNVVLWIVLAIVVVAGAAAIVIVLKKKKA